jgi:hypothetical protein
LVGKVFGGEIAADRTTPSRVAGSRRCQRYDEHFTCDLGHHQPVRRRDCRVEVWTGIPKVVDILKPVIVMFKEVSSLVVYLERIVIIELIQVEEIISHVIDCNTFPTDTP